VDLNVINDRASLAGELVSALTPPLTAGCSDHLQREGGAAQLDAYAAAAAAITAWWRTNLRSTDVGPAAPDGTPDVDHATTTLAAMTPAQAARTITRTVDRMSRCDLLDSAWPAR
jgi:hypothetical protein